MPRPKKDLQSKLVMKGHREFRHDLFKAEIAEKKHNVSWKWGEPKIRLVEHSHYFHTHDSHGKPQTKTTAQAGHWHEVTWEMKDGVPVAKCGPPLHQVTRDPVSGKRFKKAQTQQLKFYDDNLNNGEGGGVLDDHTHEMTYIESEVLSAAKVQARNQATAQAIPGDHVAKEPEPLEGFNP